MLIVRGNSPDVSRDNPPAARFPGRRPRFPHRQLTFVIVGVLHLLGAVGEVAEHAHGVLDALVVDIGALDGVADQVEQGVDKALAFAQLFPSIVAG